MREVRLPAAGVCFSDFVCGHWRSANASARAFDVVLMCQGFLMGEPFSSVKPTAQPWNETPWNTSLWRSKNSATSGLCQPSQSRGHSKVTDPPALKTCSACNANFENITLDCFTFSPNFFLNGLPNLWRLSLCQGDPETHGMAAHKLGWTHCEIWYASCSSATADSKSMCSFANRTCGMLRSLNTLPIEELGEQANSNIGPTASCARHLRARLWPTVIGGRSSPP